MAPKDENTSVESTLLAGTKLDGILTRLQLAAFTLLLLASAVVFLNGVLRDPDVPFLTSGIGAAWITIPSDVGSDAIVVDLEWVPSFEFSKRFRVAEGAGPAIIEARALREMTIHLNGQFLSPATPVTSWKETTRIEVGDALREGANELRVEVRNPMGPPILQLSLRGPGVELESSPQWAVSSASGPLGQALPARDTRLLPEALAVPRPAEIFARHFFALATLFACAALVYAVLESKLSESRRQDLPRFALGLVTLYWGVVFATKVVHLPVMTGFDIPAHLFYLDFLMEKRALPLATDGFSTYHPPLFYLLTALGVATTGVEQGSGAGQVVYRLVSFSAGLVSVWISYACARIFFPKDPLRSSLAVAFAGLVPMNLIMSSYVSNETLQSCFVGLAFWLACKVIFEGRRSLVGIALTGGALGLAILTKATSLILIPVFAVALGARMALPRQADESDDAARSLEPTRGIAAFALVVLGAALVGGWFYLRNWLHFGRFVIVNVDLPGRLQWWLQPGFHTADYYTGFGEVLRHPFFSGFHSFWDGVYSTFWGDGLVAGMIHLATRHPMWSYDFMTLSYWVGLPISVLIALGFARSLERAFRDPSRELRIAYSLTTALVFVLAFSLFFITFRVAYYAQTKAFYVLSVLPPLSIVAANGLAEIPTLLAAPRHRGWRIAYFGWLGMSAGVLALSFLA